MRGPLGLARVTSTRTWHRWRSPVEPATGKRPRGWLGAGLSEIYNTLDILAEEGVIYCGDWNNDDQPHPMKVKSGKMFAIPYCAEINDIPLYMRKGYTGEQYLRSVIDQFDRSEKHRGNAAEPGSSLRFSAYLLHSSGDQQVHRTCAGWLEEG